MSGSSGKVRILFVQNEMKTWRSARMWGYDWHLGLEEGFAANGVEVTMLLSPWFPKAKELCAGKTFDQVWINDITHMFEPQTWREFRLTEADLEWLAGLAPVCLGFNIESLQYTEKEYAEAPFLRNALNILKRTIPYLTHVMVPDEKDFDIIRQLSDIPLSWLMIPIPQRCITREIPPPTARKPFFYGTPYGERARWLNSPTLDQLIENRLSSDNATDFPMIFDRLHRNLHPQAISRQDALHELYGSYLDMVRDIRRRSFEMYLEDLGQGSAVVNLPSYAKIHTGRVYEGMATGRPVITMNIENSPRMSALFEDEKEILLYPPDDPAGLARQIQRVLDEPDFGRWIAANATEKMLRFHTAEKRVRQILDWIESGRAPDFTSEGIEETEIADEGTVPKFMTVDPPASFDILAKFEKDFRHRLTLPGRIRYELFSYKIRLFEFLSRILARASVIKRALRS